MSVIERSDLISDSAFQWPDDYAKKLETLAAKSKGIGQGGAKQGLSELEKVQRQLSVATQRSTKEYIDQKAALNTLNTQTRNAVKDVQNLDNAYDKLSKELNDARKEYKNLAAAGKANDSQARRQLKTIQKLDGQLKKIDNSVGQNQRSVGKYSDALKGVTARFIGWGAAIAAAFKVLKSGLNILIKYTSANSTLNAVLGKTRKETADLRKQQQELGATTAFAASQVANAQTELARLGKTQSEIIKLTPAILDAAVAMKVDLAEAAELVAGQLNAFNLEASEGQRVADVLTKSTQISAFNFERLKTSLAVVSPAANAVNANIENTIAVLSSAIDANIDASTAATGLRNIYIDLANKGLTWDEAMSMINGSTDRLSTANELFGKRGAVVATVIADNTDKIQANTKALNNAAGAAKKFADEEIDNLKGDLTLLTSAWEGFILSIEEGDGFISNFLRWTIQALTNDLSKLREIVLGLDPRFERWKKNIQEAGYSSQFLEKQIALLNRTITEEQEKLDAVDADFTGRAENIRGYRQQLAFLTEILARTKKEEIEIAKKVTKTTEEIDDNTEAVERNYLAFKKLDNLTAELPDKLTFLQRGLLKLTEHLFGKSTIDQDSKEFTDKVGDAIKKTGEQSAEQRKKDLEQEQLLEDQKQAIRENSFELAGEIGNNFADLRIQQISDELTALEFARDRELQKVEGNKRAEAELNKKYDAQRRELQRKQIRTERANALFQIALKTAIAIASANTLIPPANIPAIIFAAATGAAQAAAVLAAPIPQFDEGSERTPKDYIAGEKRPELRKSKGKWSLVDKPTLFKDSPGDKIISGKQTDSILGSIADITNKNILNDPGLLLNLLNNNIPRKEAEKENLAYIIEKGNSDLINTIKNKKELLVSVNTSRARVLEKHGNTYVDHIDKYYRR